MIHRSLPSTAAAALLAAGPALAGGFSAPVITPTVAPPPVVPTVVAPSADWSGAYVGGQLGFGRLDAEVAFDGEELGTLEDDGPILGVHAGYLFDFGRLVAGAELDWDATQISLVDSEGVENEFGQLDSVARAKARLGFDAGRFLPYVTAGVARASFSYEEEELSAPFEENYTGRFVGLGVSYMASERVMVSLEALRHNFDDAPDYEDDAVNPELVTDTTVNTLTIRGSFRF